MFRETDAEMSPQALSVCVSTLLRRHRTRSFECAATRGWAHAQPRLGRDPYRFTTFRLTAEFCLTQTHEATSHSPFDPLEEFATPVWELGADL